MSSVGTPSCEPCKFRSKNSQALKYCNACQEHLCKECVNFHKSFKATRAHFLVSYADQDSLKLSHEIESSRLCKDHNNRTTEFYCIEHGTMLCSLCLLQSDHTICANKIVNMETLGKSIVESKFDKKIKDEFKKLVSNSRSAVAKMKTAQGDMKMRPEAAKRKIEEIRTKIIQEFDRQTKHIIQHAIEISEETCKGYEITIEKLERLVDSTLENEALLEAITETGSSNDIFIYILSILKQLDDFHENIKRLDNDSQKTELFFRKTELLELLHKNEKPLVEFQMKKTNVKWLTLIQENQIKHELQHHIDAYIPQSPTKHQDVMTGRDTSILTDVANSVMKISTTDDTGHTDSSPRKSKNEDIKASDILRSSSDEISIEREIVEKQPTSKKTNRDAATCLESKEQTNRDAATCLESKEQTQGYDLELSHGYTFHVTTPDKNVPRFGGISVLKDERLVLSDYNNSRLILLSDDCQVVFLKPTGYAPGQMALLNSKSLAVCLMKTNQILLLDVQDNKLKKEKYIQTRYHPKCVQAVGENILVSCEDKDGGWYLDLMTSEGYICRQIKHSRILDGRIIAVQTLPGQTDSFRIIQCCGTTNNLQCFESDGSFVFNHKIENGSCVVTDAHGYIFVVRYTGEIQLFAPNGAHEMRLNRQSMFKSKFAAFNGSEDKLFLTTKKSSRIHVVNVNRSKKQKDVIRLNLMESKVYKSNGLL